MKEMDYLSKSSHKDFVASMFLKNACGLRGLKFTTREVTVGSAKVKLLHVEGVSELDGRIADADFWPSRCQTLDDLKKMPETLEDVRLRFGVYTDETTGEVVAGKNPTFLGYYVNGEFITFNGKKPEWDDASSKSIWSNEPAK